MHTDLSKLSDGDLIVLYPNGSNPIHSAPVTATFQGGFFYCEGTDPAEGPDYYARDVLKFNFGFDWHDQPPTAA